MPKLTETFARKQPPAKTGTERYWDTEVRGFVLYVGKRSKTWYYQRDVGGKTRRALIGRYPTISAQAARETALSLALEWGRGAGKKVQMGAPTLENALDAYINRPKLRSDAHKRETRRQVERLLGDWLKLPLDEISKPMVVERHRTLIDTPSTANHLLRRFRTIWNYARRTRELPECPTMAIEWYKEHPSDEVIEDLQEWLEVIEALQNPLHTAYYKLLLFTGFRRTEALKLEWRNVHIDRIHLPMTKNGRSFDLPITNVHLEILAPIRNYSSKWVFPSPRNPDHHLSAPTRLRWTPHSHRRTFATVAVEAGVLEEAVGRLLNHTPLSVTGQRYAKPSVDSLRPTMEAICEALHSRTGLDPSGY